MVRVFKNIILSVLLIAVMVVVLPQVSYAELGSTIEETNCSTSTETLNDYRLDSNLKSCKGKGIKLTGTGDYAYKVKISYEPVASFTAMYVATCVIVAYPLFVYLGPAGMAAAGTACGVDAASIEGDVWVPLGNKVKTGHSSLLNMDVLSFEARIEGDKACIYGQGGGLLQLNWKAERSATYNLRYGIKERITCPDPENSSIQNDNTTKTGSLPSHCVYIPTPEIAKVPDVPAFISPVCLDYNLSATQFRWPPDRDSSGNIKQVNGVDVLGEPRSFTGIIVQCVEDTFMNLFFNKHLIDGQLDTKTIFMKMQGNFSRVIQLLLVLYIICLGYKHGILEKGTFKQEDAIWVGLRIAIVFYFAMGAGVTNWLPGVLDAIKQMSVIIMDAGAGDSVKDDPDYKKTKRDELIAKAELYQNARTAYANARFAWSQTPEGPAKDTAKETMDEKKEDADAAALEFDKARVATLSFGYNYCDFRQYFKANRYDTKVYLEKGIDESAYTDVQTEGSGETAKKYIIRNMGSMQLWDTIDCKIAKYLGIGANTSSPKTPQLLLIGIASLIPFGPIGPGGMIVTFLTIIFLVFVILVVVRVVHIYIISFISLVLLVYISPLVIPMMLFNYTKYIFDSWVKQVVAYSVQPILLFAFLAFMFAIFDSIIFGDNYDFKTYDPTKPITRMNPSAVDMYDYNIPDLNDNTIKKIQNNDGYWVCPDEDTIGCMYQRFVVSVFDVSIFGAKIISLYNLGNRNITVSTPVLYADSISIPSATDVSDALSGCPSSDTQNLGSWNAESGSSSNDENPGALTASQWGALIVALLKLVFMSFILHALLGQVEEMSVTITNAAAGGAASMSAVPRPNTGTMVGGGLSKIGSGAAAAGSFAAKHTVGRALKNSRRAGIAAGKAKSAAGNAGAVAGNAAAAAGAKNKKP